MSSEDIVSTHDTFMKSLGIELSDDDKRLSYIYPEELTISETTESTSFASYLDLLFTLDKRNNITTCCYSVV